MRAVKENLFHTRLLAPGGLLAIFGIPRLMGASPQSPAASLNAEQLSTLSEDLAPDATKVFGNVSSS